MKIDELIEELEDVREKHGNLEIDNVKPSADHSLNGGCSLTENIEIIVENNKIHLG